MVGGACIDPNLVSTCLSPYENLQLYTQDTMIYRCCSRPPNDNVQEPKTLRLHNRQGELQFDPHHFRIPGVKIQAICKQSLLQRLQMHCDVGKWKVINNFTLSPATGIYRHTDHVYKIHFLSQTTITDSNLQCENMFLDLKDFRDIINGSHDKHVVGEVLEVSGLDIVVSAKKEVTKIDFVLRDIKYKVELLVQDETGESKFTVNDTVAASMVKTKASKLVNVQSYELQDQDVLPPEIVEIVGKTYGFGISVDEVDVFSASKFWNLNDIMWKRIKSLHEMSIHPMKKQCTSSMKIEYIDHDGEKEKKND
ncbi:hypothetical protein Bca4012_058101 [Brassica carinata]